MPPTTSGGSEARVSDDMKLLGKYIRDDESLKNLLELERIAEGKEQFEEIDRVDDILTGHVNTLMALGQKDLSDRVHSIHEVMYVLRRANQKLEEAIRYLISNLIL